MSDTTPNEEIVRYVVVVHGIGEQRKNETVLPVINRFAEARRGRVPSGRGGHPLSLGLLSAYREYGHWIELDGIPRDPNEKVARPFIGRRLQHPSGRNLRFVDLHWADVMQGHYDSVGEDLDPWSTSLLQRLNSREAPDWILEVIRSMRQGLIPAQKVLEMRLPWLSDKVFKRFLGDVQLYGEFGPTRGRGIRVFHDILAKLEQGHGQRGCTGTPRFTVIAHSLGSVLAFDALLLAHGVRQDEGAGLDGPAERYGLPGYGSKPEEYPSLDWIKSVDSLVTLGSPIDKFLVLWWLNYQHLDKTDWLDPELVAYRKALPIRHYNYCDEQDPVGHELDVAYSAPAVKEVFGERPEEQFVFTRYSAPGVAHVRYWTDSQLFARILDLAVDGIPKEEARPVNWFRLGTYFKALVASYLALPLLGWVAATFTMLWAMKPDIGWSVRLPLILSSLGILALTLWLMKLVVQWRQVMRSKRRQKPEALPPRERRQRGLAVLFVRAVITVGPFLWAYLLVATILAAIPSDEPAPAFFRPAADLAAAVPAALGKVGEVGIFAWKPKALQNLDLKAYFASLIVSLIFAFIIGLWNLIVFTQMKWKWTDSRMPMKLDFGEYMRTDPSAKPPDL